MEKAKAAVESGTIDEYDIVLSSDNQVGWVDKDKNLVLSQSRTSKDISVNGVTGLGLEDGATIPAGKSLEEIVAMLVQKRIAPTYKAPTLKFSNNGGSTGIVEVGSTVVVKANATFTQNNAGDLTSITVYNGSEVAGTSESSPYQFVGEEYVIAEETLTYKAVAAYGDGAVLQDNFGEDNATGQIKAGSLTSSTITVTGKRCAFYGAVSSDGEITSDVVRSLDGKYLNPTSGKEVTFTAPVGSKTIVVAVPAAVSEIAVEYKEANDKNCRDNFTVQTVNVADARGEQNNMASYQVFTYTMDTASEAAMTFIVTFK
jgi:hypothetical protein